MQVTTRAVFDIESGALESWEGFEYSGPVEHCGGGPSPEQRQAASSQANLSDVQAKAGEDALNYVKAERAKITPYATGLMTKGDPFYGAQSNYAAGDSSRAFAPAYQALNQRLKMAGPLPQGYAMAARKDLDASRASDFDSRLYGIEQNQNATRMQGANILNGQQATSNPQGYFGGAGAANQSILGANLQRPGIMGLLGGIAGGAASAIPF